MTKEELEKLIEGKPDDVKAKGILLFNAHIKAQLSVKEDPSAQNLKNMKASEDALTEFSVNQGGGKTGENFANIAAVFKYLEESGWKVSDKSLYRHINIERKLLRQSDGTFSRKAVDVYAAAYLKQTATGKKKQEAIDDLQRQKLDEELKNIRIKNKRDQFNFDKDQGLFVPREQLEIELATRAGIFLAGLKHWTQANAADWIDLVGGDTKKVGELINKMTGDIDEHINHYAGSREYEAVIEAEPEAQGRE